ncbi:hypothetical protein [Brachybacterium nesterenkovii]|uniref:hypothetical protein n=1 Tax=Brachybacterium nesterenkovii TaxID=47847 RepID=UPI003219D74C
MMTPPAGELVTSLDVLDDFFGGLPEADIAESLTAAQVDDLGTSVNAASQKLSRMKPSAEPIGDLIYPGGWLGNGWQHEVFRPELNCALLYQPRLLVHDPLAEYFFSELNILPEVTLKGWNGIRVTHGARMWANTGRHMHRGDDIDGVRADLKAIFGTLRHFEKLIRSGVVVMRSQFPILNKEWHALDASVRADMRSESMAEVAARREGAPLPRWDNLRGAHASPPGGLLDPADPAQWKSEYYYLAKTLMFSGSAGAHYAPASDNELALLQAKSTKYSGGSQAFTPSRPLVDEVLRQMAPDMKLDPDTTVKVRESEEAFEAWRIELRGLQRASAGIPDEELPQLVKDTMQPRIDEVRKAVSKSYILRRNAPRNLGLALIAGISAAPSGPGGAAFAAASTGVGGIMMDMYGRRQLDGSKPVIAALLHQS